MPQGTGLMASWRWVFLVFNTWQESVRSVWCTLVDVGPFCRGICIDIQWKISANSLAKHEAFRESRFVPWHLPVLLSLSLTLTVFLFLFHSFFLPPALDSYTHSLSLSHLYSSITPSINNRVVGNHETAYRVWTTDSANEKRVHRYYHQGSFKITIALVFLPFVFFCHFKLRFLEFPSDRLTSRDCFVLFVLFLLSW